MVRLASGLLMGLLLLTIVPLRAPAYAPIDDQVSELESQVAELRNQVAQRTVRVQSHPTEGAALPLRCVLRSGPRTPAAIPGSGSSWE